MTAPRRWDDLGPDWHVEMADTVGHALSVVFAASAVWRNLTRPQREVILSAAAGAPIAARSDVLRRLARRGLITGESAATGAAVLTAAGRSVVKWAPR